MIKSHKYLQGVYKIKNPLKYVGDKNNVIYRSSPERRLQKFCDENNIVKFWSSEEVVIPYKNPTKNFQISRYFVDFFIEFQNGMKCVVEYKPSKFTHPPKKTSKNYLSESLEYVKNLSKWRGAEKYCLEKGYKFLILTEKHFKTEDSDRKILESFKKVFVNHQTIL